MSIECEVITCVSFLEYVYSVRSRLICLVMFQLLGGEEVPELNLYLDRGTV